VLFAAMAVIWGIPYLLIKVAIAELTPATLVLARTTLGALLLLPLAMAHGDIRPLFAHWRPVLAYTFVEVAGPWILLADAERKLSSSLAGLLIAGVPLVGALLAWLVSRGERPEPPRAPPPRRGDRAPSPRGPRPAAQPGIARGRARTWGDHARTASRRRVVPRYEVCGLSRLARSMSSNEHAAGRPRVNERDVALRPVSRRTIDQLHPMAFERTERRPKIIDHEADVVQRRLSPLGEELCDA